MNSNDDDSDRSPSDDTIPPSGMTLSERQQHQRERVFKACQTLVDADERISTRRVRVAIGGGNPNEINPWIKEWKARHQQRQQQLAELEAMPKAAREALLKALEPFLAQAWSIVRHSANAELEQFKASVASEQRERDDEIADWKALSDDLQGELELAQQSAAEHARIADAASAAQHVADARTTDAREETAAARAERDRLREALANEQAALSTATAQRQRLEAHIAHLEAQQSSLQEEHASTVAALNAQQARCRDLEAACQDAHRQHTRDAERLQSMTESLTTLQDERDRARSALSETQQTLQAEISTLRAELAKAQGQLLSQQQLQALLAQQLHAPQEPNTDPPTP